MAADHRQLTLLHPLDAPLDALALLRNAVAISKARAEQRHGKGLVLVRPVRTEGSAVPELLLLRKGTPVLRCTRPAGPPAGAFSTAEQLAQAAREWWAVGSYSPGCRGCGSLHVPAMRLCELCERREEELARGESLSPGLFDGT